MSESPAVHIERTGRVWVVTLQRPGVRNAVDTETARALHTAFLAFEDDVDARVAVFHGAHGHFCSGWDLQHGAHIAASGDSNGFKRPANPSTLSPRGLAILAHQ